MAQHQGTNSRIILAGMLKFVTKKQYWDVEDSGFTKEYPGTPDWHLKSIQDAVTWSLLRTEKDQDIAEVGGGDSRLLRSLATHNRCCNIEPFGGSAHGPRKEVTIDGVTNVLVTVGEFSELLRPAQFDIVFSVSVVEHVPTSGLADFFNDCHRILKPGGRMIHLIDAYVEGADGDNEGIRERVSHYARAFGPGLFETIGPVMEPHEVAFRTEFASNPDDEMNHWNRLVPNLRAKREVAQSCTLLMQGIKREADQPAAG